MSARSLGRVTTVLVCIARMALTASAYEIGHTSTVYLDPARDNRQVGVEIYYPATVAGDDVPVAPPPAGGFPPIAFGHGYMMAYDDYDYMWTALVPAGYILALPRTEGGLFPSHEEFGAGEFGGLGWGRGLHFPDSAFGSELDLGDALVFLGDVNALDQSGEVEAERLLLFFVGGEGFVEVSS